MLMLLALGNKLAGQYNAKTRNSLCNKGLVVFEHRINCASYLALTNDGIIIAKANL